MDQSIIEFMSVRKTARFVRIQIIVFRDLNCFKNVVLISRHLIVFFLEYKEYSKGFRETRFCKYRLI